MFSFENVKFRYDPYPIGLIKPVMDERLYGELVDSYPPVELFQFMPKFGNKYSLSEKFNAQNYATYIKSHPRWRELHDWVKSREFIASVVAMLEHQHIDLGMRLDAHTFGRRLKVLRREIKRRRWPRTETPLSSRFEFSMLPADGGYHRPHTDNPTKYITLVVSMVKEGEWNPAFGGGTDVLRTKHCEHSYNLVNNSLEFDDVERIDTFDFTPNQSVVFIKTFNSLHSVWPMTGKGSPAMRRTLTINIEADL